MRIYNFTLTEYHLDQPWIVVGSGRHRVELDDEENFYTWAMERWPGDSFKVTLDPGDLTREPSG